MKLDRPQISEDIKKQAAESILSELKKWANFDAWTSSVTNPLDDLIEVASRHDNGYEIAKQLENMSWNIDCSLIDLLDNFSYTVEQEYKKVLKKWVDDNNITPPLKPGTRVKFYSGGRDKCGIIADEDGYHKEGKYHITMDGETNPNRFLILEFERVEGV